MYNKDNWQSNSIVDKIKTFITFDLDFYSKQKKEDLEDFWLNLADMIMHTKIYATSH